jgi:tetratricopeptide (TPR) repeat protein
MKSRTIFLSAIFLFSLLGSGWGAAQQTTPQQSEVKPLTADDLVKQGQEAYKKKEYAKSAQALQEAIAKGARSAGVYYDAACSLALSGEKDKAFQLLNQAIQAGWRNTEHLKSDSDLTALREDPRWTKVIAASDAQQTKYLKDHNDPKKAQFVTEDIARFWKAYDKAMAATQDQRESIFQREYIDPGTIGLKDFSRSGRLNAKTLAKVIEGRPNFFKAIRPLTSGIEKQRAETIAAFRKLKQIYPDAIFPNDYFVIGQLSSGGTASDNGLLMGAEMFTRAAEVPTSELNDWEKGAIMAQSDIPALVAHESIHFQQKYSAQGGMLCQCLKEGSADFLGELSSGRLIARMRETHAWANARERELWEEFQKDMETNKTSRWLYGSSGGNGRPVDLGYWMGYKISEAYYKNAADKKQAVRDMLLVKDCKEFLKASRYAEKVTAGAPVQK